MCVVGVHTLLLCTFMYMYVCKAFNTCRTPHLVYVYKYVHVHIHVYVHVYDHIYIFVNMNVYIHACLGFAAILLEVTQRAVYTTL